MSDPIAPRPGCQPCVPPSLDPALCDGCGLCVRACPCGAATMGPLGPRFTCGQHCHLHPRCVAVAHAFFPCESTCPRGALQGAFAIRDLGPTPH